MHQIELFKQYPIEVQSEVLEHLIRHGKNTEFGRKHNFSAIESSLSFAKNVPLQDYDSLKLYIDRQMNGEESILYAGATKWFAKSSGTTSERSKFIPVTQESLMDCHYKGGKDLLAMYYTNHPNRKLYNGKHLIVGGSAQINQLTADSYFGDLSAIIVKNLPWWAEIRRTPSREIALMDQWEKKILRMAESTAKEDVYIIAGVPSWTLVLMRKVLEITGKRNLKEVWPNLELFMHGGVSFEPYRKAFEELIPDPNMNYVETYNASEGFFGIQDLNQSGELLLMLDYGIYYEFIPMSTFKGLNSDEVLSLKDVIPGVNYAMVITTNGGLWRYVIGDTIKFTSTKPYRFKITGRTKSFLNMVGEELVVENAENAIARASLLQGVVIREFTAGPLFSSQPGAHRHEWLIELDGVEMDLDKFTMDLDSELRKLNSDYDAKRIGDLVLEKPLVQKVRKNGFQDWLLLKGKLGGQNKIPRLMNDRKILNELHMFLANTNE